MYADIYTAVEGLVLTVLDPDFVQLPNTFMDAGNRDWWARITHLPLNPVTATLGIGGQNLREGLTQVDIFNRVGTGRHPQADLVVSTCTRTTQLALPDGVIYQITAYHESGDLVQEGYWQDRVLLRWSALTSF